ncbi:hypothetical protein LBMAG53_19670 [Planctomycetota bacterium]|nr:hypothetical protein LBMAG53_19670 [Planctomycetota bacterium]
MTAPDPTGFVEPRPDAIAANPGGANDPLGESVLGIDQPWLRVFQPADLRVVIGRHQDPDREVQRASCQAAGVPVHRRVTGGGAVVLAPGMVVVALRRSAQHQPETRDPVAWFAQINAVLVPVIRDLTGITPIAHRLGDLAMPEATATPRKILGASLRQNARLTAYLGVFLVDDAAPLMERYLRQPSREPDYRGGRDHRTFCTHLSRWGVTADQLSSRLIAHLTAELG